MNKELKHLLVISISLFLIFIFILNINTYHGHHFIPQASKQSQIICRNRLRAPWLRYSSEKWPYPKIDHRQLELIAVKKQHLILVVDTNKHQAIYAVHAQINPSAQTKPLTVLRARGQQIYHIIGARQTTGQYWLGISNGDYIESPLTGLNQQRVPHRLTKVSPVENTIQVSRPDAKWLQQVPKNTPLLIKEDY